MKYGSICSGVEAATLAWRPLGWKAVFFAEVEPFPSAVLCYRFKATRPLRPLDPAMADNEKERKTRELWRRQGFVPASNSCSGIFRSGFDKPK